jgi:acyl carrier protein
MIEEDFQITVLDEEISSNMFVTVGALVEYVESKVSA